MPYFIIPFDFIRVYSVFSAVDFFALIVFFIMAVQGRLCFRYGGVFVFFLVLIAYTLLAGLVSGEILESSKLAAVFVLISVKVYLVFHYVNNQGWEGFVYKTAIGFLLIYAMLFVFLMLGLGYSGSGRFSGFFGSSNGLANFAILGVVFGAFLMVSDLRVKKIGFSVFFASLAAGLLTASKGFVVFFMIIVVFWLIVRFVRNYALRACFFLMLVPGVFFGAKYIALGAMSAINYVQIFFGVDLERVMTFLMLVADLGVSSELDYHRDELNRVLMDKFSSEPRFFGYGYESAAFFTDGQRAHNVLLTALFELGLPFFCLISFLFLMVLFSMLKVKYFDKIACLVSFLGLAVILLSMKTPFYFIYAFPWFVMLALCYRFFGGARYC